MNTHLHILHLFSDTDNDKVNAVSDIRLKLLLEELSKSGISEYTILRGVYEPSNTKKAIHEGHRQIVLEAKKNVLENCIVAEDDLVFTSPNSYRYFLSQIPKSYDLFCGLFYAGSMEGNRIMNGASGIMTLYSIHNRFYDFFLSLDTNTHIDRELGQTAYKHEYYVCQPMVVTQRGGWSFNRREVQYYDDYLVGKELFSG